MNDGFDDLPDDPLGRALRDEIPAPGPRYWTEIDSRLAAAAEIDNEGIVDDLVRIGQRVDTTRPLVRLKDMRPTNPAHSSTARSALALAAVAALVAGIVGFLAISANSDSSATVVAADGADGSQPDAPGASVDGVSDAGAEPDPDIAVDEAPANSSDTDANGDSGSDPSVGVAPDAPPERRCFFEQYLPEDDPDPSVIWVIEFDGNSFRSLIESRGPAGAATLSEESGTLSADGVGRTGSNVRIDFYEGGASRTEGEFEPFTAAEVECTEVADAEQLFARLGQIDTEPASTTSTVATTAPASAEEDGSETSSSTPPEEVDLPPPTTTDTEPAGPVGDLAFAQSLVGLTLEAAQAAADEAGHPFRIVGVNGEDLAVTGDFIENRINVVIEDGIVTTASLG